MRVCWTGIVAMALLGATLTVAFAQGGPVIAVMPFYASVVDSSWHWTHNSRRWGAGAGVADLIAGELVSMAQQSGLFRVVERDRLFEVMEEQDLAASGRIDPATAARIGRIIGADLLVMGAVTRFDVQSDHIGLPHQIGFDAERHKATVGFEGRLVDTETAQIIVQAHGNGDRTRYGATIRRGELRGLDFGSSHFRESLLGQAAREAARSMAREVTAGLDYIAGHGRVPVDDADAVVVYVETRGDQVWPMINRGARDGVREGDVLVIRRKRQDVYDPVTGELLKTIWDEVGVMTIREVDEKVASGPIVPAPGTPGIPQEGDVAILRGRN
ncbi:MAG: CsgG/HfaB family protein [Armatimonadota bacterium]